MVGLNDEFFAMLRLAKNLYDYGIEKELKKWFGGTELDGDYYWELAYEAIREPFSFSHFYYAYDFLRILKIDASSYERFQSIEM